MAVEVKKYEHEFMVQELNPSLMYSNVRVIHMPSGLYADCGIYRSQRKNRNACIEAIQEKLNTPQ